MSAKVATLRGEPVDDVVGLLEEKLQDARDGQIRAIAMVFVAPGDIVGTAWERGDAGTYLHELTAGSGYLQYRLVASALED